MTTRRTDVPRLDSRADSRTRRAIEALAKIHNGGGAVGTYADMPLPGEAGRIFFPTNSPYIYLDDGSVWLALHPRTFKVMVETFPQLASFSFVNQGLATATQGGTDVFLFDNATAGNNVRLLVKAAPSTPYTVTACFLHNTGLYQGGCGIFFRASGSGSLVSLFVQNDTINAGLYSGKWTSPTLYSATYRRGDLTFTGFPYYLRLADNGTNRIASFSNDGINFTPFQTVGRTDFITANQIGIGWYSQSTASPNDPGAATDEAASYNWLSWSVT